MLGRWAARVAALALAGLAGGCESFGLIDSRTTSINENVGSLQNRALLLNLARASQLEPMYFLSMSNISGSATEDLKLGLPSFAFGPNKNAVLGRQDYTFGGNATNVLDSNAATSFQVGVLGSKDFYSGLLSPLDLSDVNLLLNQGFPRELVYLLVIDRVTVTDVTGLPSGDESKATVYVFYNNPNTKGYSTGGPAGTGFEGLIDAAMRHGLVTEAAPYRSPAAPELTSPSSPGAAPTTGAQATLTDALSKLADALKKTPGGGAQLCYDWSLAAEAAHKDLHPESLCGYAPISDATSPAPPSKLTVQLYGRSLQIDVKTRSVYGMLNYLGGLIADGKQGEGIKGAVHLHEYKDLTAETTGDAVLLNVVQGAHPAGGCFTSVTYEGQHYCVPNGPDSNTTKRIFNILNALLALKTSTGDLPVTQTVRIAP
ncbi:MAG TPA: hypothetical protein VHX64_13630 [Caulobacteraceae bacterium]|jgi:hypothetical protein|nr:hypothetical protein [Caulobacteraceae bacterium]